MSDRPEKTASARQRLADLHGRVGGRFATTTAAIGAPIGCDRGCSSCCVDELTVWRPEADRITALIRDRGLTIAVHPPGACAFLDAAGACQVYRARPYVCRSQGAVLRLHDEGERRFTCAEHLRDVDLHRLPEEAMFELGPAEEELLAIATADLVERGEKGLPERVPLRRLALSSAAGSRPC